MLKRLLIISALWSFLMGAHAATVEDYFSNPNMFLVSLSPNGNNVSVAIQENDKQVLYLINTETLERTRLFDLDELKKNEFSIHKMAWIDDKHIIAQFSEIKKGIKDLLDTKTAYSILVFQLPDNKQDDIKILTVQTRGWLVDPLESSDDTFLFAKSNFYSNVYKINTSKLNEYKKKMGKRSKIDGGQFITENKVANVDGYATRWFIDPEGQPVSVLYYSKDDLLLSAIAEDGSNTVISKWTKKQRSADALEQKEPLLYPIAMAENNKTYYCLDYYEDEEHSVYKVNFETETQELIFESSAYKIIGINTEGADNKLVSVRVLRNGKILNKYIDTDVKNDGSNKNQGNRLEAKIKTSLNSKKSIYYSESYNQPGIYEIRDEATNRSQTIGSPYPALTNNTAIQLIEGDLPVEELPIPYLLTIPKASQSPVPLVVMPHGGPFYVYDNRYFDNSTYYLNSLGYAVLRVNFRGSGGYSTEFVEAGKKQFGNLMLEDIYQVTQHIQSRPDIDSKQTCILGFSYGGYASTMLSILYPETYKCGINVAGVSDMNLLLNTKPLSSYKKSWAKDFIGDTANDYASMKAISPVYDIDKLQVPLFIAHGADDKVVDVEHAYRLKLMLEAHNKAFKWQLYPEADHTFEVDDRIHLFKQITSFLKQNLN